MTKPEELIENTSTERLLKIAVERLEENDYNPYVDAAILDITMAIEFLNCWAVDPNADLLKELYRDRYKILKLAGRRP